MHAQYVNLKVNEVLFYFHFAGQPQDTRVPMVLYRMWRIGKWLRTLNNTRREISYYTRVGGGGEGTFLYLPYRYVPPHFTPFLSERGYRLCLFWSGIGYGFRANAWPYMSFQFQMNKKERVINEFEVDFKKSFSWHSNPRIVNSRLADTSIIPTAAKSQVKINFSRLTEINSRYFGLSLMRTPSGGPYSVWVGFNDNIISAYARSENGCGKCQFWGVK